MNNVSGVGSSGDLLSQESTMLIIDPSESAAIDFFNGQYVNQLIGVVSEEALKGSH